MENKKIDQTRLKTVNSFARIKNVTVQHIYRLAKEKKIKMIEIDGVKFIQLE